MKALTQENENMIFRPALTQMEMFLFCAGILVAVLCGAGILMGSWLFAVAAPVVVICGLYAACFRNSPPGMKVQVSDLTVTVFAGKTPVFSVPVSEVRSVGTMRPDMGSRSYTARGVFLSVDPVASPEQLSKKSRIVIPLIPGEKAAAVSGHWVYLGEFQETEARRIAEELQNRLGPVLVSHI